MKRTAPWAWTATGVALDRDLDGSPEQVWVSPDLPPERDRGWYRLGVEVYCMFGDDDQLNEGLRALWQAFGRDTVLVAIRRHAATCRILTYTVADEEAVHRRYLAVRDVLRPIAMGLRLEREPGWPGLAEVLSYVEPQSDSPLAPRASGGDPPGALR